jgi:hypothetical protein
VVMDEFAGKFGHAAIKARSMPVSNQPQVARFGTALRTMRAWQTAVVEYRESPVTSGHAQTLRDTRQPAARRDQASP